MPDIRVMLSAGTLQQEVLDATNTAFSRLPDDLARMGLLLTNPDKVLNDRLDYLFGSHDAPALGAIRAVVDRLRQVISRPVSWSCTWSKNSDPNEYAHVYTGVDPMQAGQMFIYLDNRYKIVQENGLNNRYLTLVHEFSHLAAGTEDHKYDKNCFWTPGKKMGDCLRNDPSDPLIPYDTNRATENADCYGFLMAATFQRVDPSCPIP
jgi:hypothetical protein